MARKQAIFPEVNFVNGLVTETTALRFPENACVEAENCIFEHTGRVTRRPGLDVEDNYSMLPLPQAYDANDVYSEYFWEVVGAQDSVPFLVLQRGAFLYLFKTKASLVYSDALFHQVIDLNDYVSGGDLLPAEQRCSFAEGRGHLLVVNKACDPLYLTYIASGDIIQATTISIKYRDFKGIDDGLTLSARPSTTVAGLKASNPEHYYNIINQGWHLSDALDQWDTARSDMPSNADVPSYYRASETDVFDNSRVNNTFSAVANTPAPKGHFILDAGSPSRTSALIAEGFTGTVVRDDVEANIPLTGLTTISGGTIANASAAFDINVYQSTASATRMNNGSYLGKTLSAATRIHFIALYPASTGFGTTGNVQVYAKTGSAPVGSTDGTLIATIPITSASLYYPWLIGTNDTTEYDHVWIRNATGSNNLYISEVKFFTYAPEFNRPNLVSFYAGRAFYAGLANEGAMNSIYFSQIIERDAQYGQCYQKNDPTDENFFDLLPDDGGVITIPEIGTIVSMVPYQNSLIVIASNGVWTISGASRGFFKANEYEIRKISDVATPSSFSVTTRRGIPLWWAEDGIYTIEYDANYDSFSVKSITEERISSFIKDISFENRRYVKAAYDYVDDKIYWLYKEAPITDPGDQHNYDSVLVMDGLTGAFYPWHFEPGGILTIKGFQYVRYFDGTATPRIKYVVENSTDNLVTFAEIKDVTNWIDWSTQGDEIDYSSYFITGYKIRGETQKDSTITYFMPFMDEEENSSLWVQSIYDYTTDPSTGKWSSRQQCYYEGPFNRSVRFRRLKVRGTGKALQFKFISETGKPFNLIGFSTNETVNAEV